MPEAQQKRTLRALVIEDVENDALLLVDMLELMGFEVFWHRVDSADQLRTALQTSWDIVFSDYAMPGFSGDLALQMLRAEDRVTPFIFVSGTIGEEAAAAAVRAGANDYVMKTNLARLMPVVERELKDAHVRRRQLEAEQQLRKLLLAVNQIEEGILITDPTGKVEYANPAAERLCGRSLEQMKGQLPPHMQISESGCEIVEQIWQSLRQGSVVSKTLTSKKNEGVPVSEELVITPLKSEAGILSNYVFTSRDITAKVKAEEEMSRLTAIIEATPDYVMLVDEERRVVYLNKSWQSVFGPEPYGSRLGARITEIFSAPILANFDQTVLPALETGGKWLGEMDISAHSGRSIPVSLVVLAHKDGVGNIRFISMIARDISERKQFETELHHRATHDSLTNLPNRFLLMDRINSAIQAARRRKKKVAVFFLDMNNFKRINDSMGHAFGDQLLVHVAQRFQANLRPSDTVARLGGDEFVLVVDELDRPEVVLTVLNKIMTEFEKPIVVDDHKIYTTFSTGISIYPSDADNVDDLLRYADAAMYRSKASGNNQYCFYAPSMDSKGHEMLALEAELRVASEKQEFQLHYQPQHSAVTGELVGYEALLRWNHPTRGLVSPGHFVPLLESSGLILPVGEWVVRQACLQHRQLRELGKGHLRISVNVSALQFSDPEFSRKIRAIFQQEEMPADRMELEITENIVVQNPREAAKVLRGLRDVGVRAAIDDFGVGYSSLSYLKTFPLNVLKIDQSFVREIDHGNGNAAIVETSVFLAKKLGMDVVAEGVETASQMRLIQESGCDLVQGFHVSRPLPQDRLTQYMEEKSLLALS